MTDWMDDFDEARKNQGRKKPLMSTYTDCGKKRPVGDDGKCVACDIRGIKK